MTVALFRVAVLVLASAVLLSSQDALTGQAASVAITMTVDPQYSFTVELYNDLGQMVAGAGPTVPPAKVTVVSPEGRRVGLSLPAGSLGAPTVVSVYIRATPGQREAVETADLKAKSAGTSPIPGIDALEFLTDHPLVYNGAGEPATGPAICLCFPPSLPDEAVDSLGVFRLDEARQEWSGLARCDVDPLACTVSAQVEGLGVFQPMVAVAADLKRAMVFPNPFIPAMVQGGVLRFANLTPEATITIYDISGRLVWRTALEATAGSATWQGTDGSGRPAASGVYLYVVTNPRGDEIAGKITLIR
ncbi:MAG: T9SS type A sorting domain-containing protein [bacterium]